MPPRSASSFPSWRPGAALAVALLTLCGCPKPSEDALGREVVALVQGEPLSRAEFSLELSRELLGSGLRDPTHEQVEPLKRALLDSLVERMLLLQEARKLAIAIPEEEVDRRLLRMTSDFPDDGFSEALGQGELTRTEFKRRVRERLTIERLFATHVYPRVAVTEAELREAYAQRASEFETPEQVRMLQIVVREVDEAQRIRGELRAGRSFEDLARRYSLSADAKVGGDLGFFPRGRMPPVFEEWAWKLSPGQLSEVVESEYGFHLFRVVERRAPSRPDFASAREALERRLVAERKVEAERAWVSGLKAGAQVRINEAALQLIQGRGEQRQAPAGK